MPKKTLPDGDRHYWVWVTGPEYYLEEDASDRETLDPSTQSDADGWWTCHRDTRQGDLILLYRTKPKMDIGYLIQAQSDAYSIADEEYASEQGWDYGCDHEVLYKFHSPLTLGDLRRDPYLDEWGALRANFRRRVYKIPEGIWLRLIALMEKSNRGFASFLRRGGVKKAATKIFLEEDLENRLAKNISVLRQFGFDLEVLERQLICVGHGGRIDLLCYDTKRKLYVVIELKNERAGQNTFGQIATYLGWVQQHHSNGKPVHGIVIARGFDPRFLSAAATNNRVSHYDLKELGFK